MKHERNVEGLRQNAQKKRQEAIKRTDAGIQQLLKEKRSVNFKSVAEVAGVSTAWLYKEPEIKARIERLREQGSSSKKKAPPKQRASDASKDAIIKTLKDRCAKLDAEIKGLREQIEVVYGQIMEIEVLKQQVEQIKAENWKLKEEVEKYRISTLSSDRSKIQYKVASLINRKTANLSDDDR